jgi:hypothetical protein
MALSPDSPSKNDLFFFVLVCALSSILALFLYLYWKKKPSPPPKETLSKEALMAAMHDIKASMEFQYVTLLMNDTGQVSSPDGTLFSSEILLKEFLQKNLESFEILQIEGSTEVPLAQLLSLFEQARALGYLQIRYQVVKKS